MMLKIHYKVYIYSTSQMSKLNLTLCTFSVTVLYASPPAQKIYPCSDTAFPKCPLYKPAFHGGHLSCNTSRSSNATIQVICLLWWEYSYSTQSSMIESYSYQCLNTETSIQGNRDYTTEIPSISYSMYDW